MSTNGVQKNINNAIVTNENYMRPMNSQLANAKGKNIPPVHIVEFSSIKGNNFLFFLLLDY